MPDTFLGLFRFCFMAGWPARHKAAQPFGLAIDDAEVAIGKADQPIAGLGFGDADRLARQCIAEKDQIAAPFDLAAGADATDGMVVKAGLPLGQGGDGRHPTLASMAPCSPPGASSQVGAEKRCPVEQRN